MALLPYRKLELYSPLPAATVVQVLRDAVEPTRWLGIGSGLRPFVGIVTPRAFDMQRNISQRNSVVPQIRGTITPDGNGSRISITMRLQLVVAMFMLAWLGGVFCAAIAAASVEPGLAVMPIAMFLLGSILPLMTFSAEAKKAEQLIVFLIDGIPRPVDVGRR